MLEQINIRKAELTKRLLDRKTREAGLDDILDDANKKLNAVNEEIAGLKERSRLFWQRLGSGEISPERMPA